jgi:hypothetical protein
MPHRIGRVSKLTPQVHASIVRAVTVGVPLGQAAQLAGIDHATALEWVARGEGRHSRATRPIYAEFAEAIARAKATDEARRLARLELAGRGGAVLHEKTTTFADGRVVVEKQFAPPDWRCDAFVLERRYPERWGRRVQADLSLEIRQLVQDVAEEIGVPADQLLAEAQAFLKEHDQRHRR